jgi:hypothetical protein
MDAWNENPMVAAAKQVRDGFDAIAGSIDLRNDTTKRLIRRADHLIEGVAGYALPAVTNMMLNQVRDILEELAERADDNG